MSRQLSGLKAWLLQRISAVYLGLFTLYVTFHLLMNTPTGFEQWSGWITALPVKLAFLLAIGLTLLHAWIGIRDVLIDYIPFTGIRLVVMTLVGLMLSGCGLWALLILL
jgi:succinate dehydrogenase / fumarate reductase membrane anchor subunit